MTAQREDLFSNPAVVAPPAHPDQPNNAKHRLAEDSGASTPTMSAAATSPEPDQIPTIEKYAFAFYRTGRDVVGDPCLIDFGLYRCYGRQQP
jgi:hypothetical protein